MQIYSHIKSLCTTLLDALFPKHEQIINLEQKAQSGSFNSLRDADPISHEHMHALFSYTDTNVRAIVLQIKFQKNNILTSAMGKLLYEMILADIQDSIYFENNEKILLIPIPSTQKRKFERGGNQSERIAKAIVSHDSEVLFEYAPRYVRKTLETTSQTKTKNRTERLSNLIGAFSVTETEKVSGRRIILIDDVITTGSTMEEVRKTLRKAGARSVECYAIAH